MSKTLLLGLTLVLLPLAPVAAGELRVDGLTCEYLVDPLGIDTPRPRLGWVIESSERGQRQTAYRVLVASTADKLARDEGDLWDSGRVESGQSINVTYDGAGIGSGQACFWKVKAWDRDGKPSAWSPTARWSMGIEPTDWKAQWIGRVEPDAKPEENVLVGSHWVWLDEGSPAASAPVGHRFFRRTFDVPAGRTIRRATVAFTADNSATVTVNGVKAGTARNFHRAPTFDVTADIRPGKNVVAIDAQNAGDSPNPAGLIGVVRVEFAEGNPLVIPTDASWRASDSEQAGWLAADFDDAAWPAVKVLGPYGMGPWKEVTAGGEDRRLPARWLRHEFDVSHKVRRATAYISGLGYYELYLNGGKVGDHVLDPAYSFYPKRVFYVTYDVTGAIRQGTNAVGAILGNGRFFAPRLVQPIGTGTYGYPQLLLQIQIEYDNGAVELVTSDPTWKLTTDGPIRENNDYDGETYDARLEMPGWSEPGFDDSAWQQAEPVDPPGGKLVPQMIEPMRVCDTLQPIGLSEPRPGVYVFDMGQNMVGWCRLRVQGKRGTVVTLRHAETIRDDGTLYLDNIRSAKVTDAYTLKGGGPEVYQPRFTYHGFRYVELRGYPGEPDLDTITGCVVHTDLRPAGSFECSHPLLNRIYRNVLWGVRGNYLGIPTDCPQRDERQGWLGDPAARSKGESFFFHVDRFYGKWLNDIEDAQLENGSVPDVAPPFWTLYTDNMTWPSAYVLIPDWIYDQYADRSVVARHYDGMKKWLDYMAGFLKDDIMPRDRYGDWCVPPESPELIHSQDPARKTEAAVLGTTYYYHDLMLMARYAELLGKSNEAEEFRARADRVRKAFLAKFYDPATALIDNGSQTSSVLPLMFDMLPEDQRARVQKNLVRNILVTCDGHIGTGLVGGQWLMRTLSDAGRNDVAFHLATNTDYPSWGYMVANDATTIWELWNGNTADPAMNSHNHLMLVGDLVIWFYEDLAGIKSDPKQPGFKHVLMKPQPVAGLDHVTASHESPYGWIQSAWKKSDGTFQWDVTIPPGTTATVAVPAADPAQVREGGRPAAEAEGVRPLGTKDGRATFEIESGTYRFTTPLADASRP